MAGVQRKLAAILSADVVGYSRLMEQDEAGTLAALKAHREELINPRIAAHGGRIVKLMGDGALVEFASVVDGVECAIDIQRAMAERNAGAARDRRIELRIGLHLGDVIVEGDDIYGDGVNVAARLQGLAEPGGVWISQQAYDQVETKLDLGYEDMGEQRVKNIARPIRAYRVHPGAHPPEPTDPGRRGITPGQWLGTGLVAVLIVAGGIAAWWQPWTRDAEPAPVARTALPLPDKPSIAVLPFENMSDDPDQEYFTDGMAEDIITDLSKISGLFVIARNSTFAYKGKPTQIEQVAQELGVRYVLEGSVRRVGDQVRINVQLVDATTGGHLWADRYDGTLDDVFAVQAEVARNVVAALAVALQPNEGKRLGRPSTDNIAVYDLFLRTRATPWPPTRENILSARRAYEHIAELDPNFVGGHAGSALTHAMAVVFGASSQPETDAEIAIAKAKRAVALDQEFAQAHSALGLGYLAAGRHDEAVESARRATELQPSDADAHFFLGVALLFAGDGEKASEAAERALRIDPQFTNGPYLNLLGNAKFIAGRYAEAIEAFKQNVARGGPMGAPMLHAWVAAYVAEGRMEEARETADELLRFFPEFSLQRFRMLHIYKNDEDTKRLIGFLRQAGLPE